MSSDDIEEKRIVRKRIWKMASEDPFPKLRCSLLRKQVHMTWDRKHLCRAAPADASCGEPGGQ